MSAIDKNVIEVTDTEATERLMEIMEGESNPLPIKKKDMVEVVRCAECVHREVPCPLYGGSQFFCAYGERRENGHD